MKENYFEKIRMRFIETAIATNDNAKDVNRNHVNYCWCAGWAQVLRDMGHKINVSVQEDDGVLKIPFLIIDGKKNQLL